MFALGWQTFLVESVPRPNSFMGVSWTASPTSSTSSACCLITENYQIPVTDRHIPPEFLPLIWIDLQWPAGNLHWTCLKSTYFSLSFLTELVTLPNAPGRKQPWHLHLSVRLLLLTRSGWTPKPSTPKYSVYMHIWSPHLAISLKLSYPPHCLNRGPHTFWTQDLEHTYQKIFSVSCTQ